MHGCFGLAMRCFGAGCAERALPPRPSAPALQQPLALALLAAQCARSPAPKTCGPRRLRTCWAPRTFSTVGGRARPAPTRRLAPPSLRRSSPSMLRPLRPPPPPPPWPSHRRRACARRGVPAGPRRQGSESAGARCRSGTAALRRPAAPRSAASCMPAFWSLFFLASMLFLDLHRSHLTSLLQFSLAVSLDPFGTVQHHGQAATARLLFTKRRTQRLARRLSYRGLGHSSRKLDREKQPAQRNEQKGTGERNSVKACTDELGI